MDCLLKDTLRVRRGQWQDGKGVQQRITGLSQARWSSFFALTVGFAKWFLNWLIRFSWGFSGGTSGKEPTCEYRRHKKCKFDPKVGKIPWRRVWQPTLVFLPGESHGQRSLVAIIHRVKKCWTWLKWLSMHTHTHTRWWKGRPDHQEAWPPPSGGRKSHSGTSAG